MPVIIYSINKDVRSLFNLKKETYNNAIKNIN